MKNVGKYFVSANKYGAKELHSFCTSRYLFFDHLKESKDQIDQLGAVFCPKVNALLTWQSLKSVSWDYVVFNQQYEFFLIPPHQKAI